MGKLAPETLVAALAAIMLWHPTGPTLEALLQPEATRRFPWLRPPEPAPMAPASEEAPAARRHLEKAATARPMPE
jgi:hypothetical protein